MKTIIVGYRNAAVAMMKAIWLKGYTLLLTRPKFIAKIEKDDQGAIKECYQEFGHSNVCIHVCVCVHSSFLVFSPLNVNVSFNVCKCLVNNSLHFCGVVFKSVFLCPSSDVIIL